LSIHSQHGVTVATVCGVWIVAALFPLPAAHSKYLCRNSVILWIIAYCQHVAVCELLVSCVLPLCVIAVCCIVTGSHIVESSFYISEWTQSLIGEREKYCKDYGGTYCCFPNQLSALSRSLDTYYYHGKQKISEHNIIKIILNNNYKLCKIISGNDYKLQYS
jgi:hypothetical protein